MSKKTTKVSRESQKEERRRPKPASGRARYNLTVPKRMQKPGYNYYWATEDQIEDFRERDYELVIDPDRRLRVGEDGKNSTSLSDAVMRPAKGDSGKNLYLMHVRADWYADDMNAAEQQIAKQEKFIRNPQRRDERDPEAYGDKSSKVERIDEFIEEPKES